MWTLTEEIKEWFDDNFSKVKFYDYILWKNYLSVLGIMSSIVTLISFFITVQDMEFDIKCKCFKRRRSAISSTN